MTRFARRATIVAATLFAVPLSFALSTASPVTLAAGQAVSGAVASVGLSVSADDVAAVTRTSNKNSKKKKKKQQPPKKTVVSKPLEGGYDALENQVVTLTNNYRTANGCGALHVDTRLVAAARAHSTDMVTRNFFDHTGSDGSNFVQREARAGYSTGASAENIAWGYRTPQDVVTAWINSPGHRANILNCGSAAVGVGLAYKADGTPYWTQDFGRV